MKIVATADYTASTTDFMTIEVHSKVGKVTPRSPRPPWAECDLVNTTVRYKWHLAHEESNALIFAKIGRQQGKIVDQSGASQGRVP